MSRINETKVLILSLFVSVVTLTWGYWLSLNPANFSSIRQKQLFDNKQYPNGISTNEAPKRIQSPEPKKNPKVTSPSGSTITNEKTSSTSSAGGEGKFADVKINKLETYTHPGGVFSMDVPEGWRKQDTSKPDEIIVAWTDPAKNSLIIMDIFEIEATPSKEDLGSKLKEFIEKAR